MRPRTYMPMLAAALTLATASPAYATEFISNGDGTSQATIAARHHSKDPAHWTLAGAGGFTYAGGGTRYPTLTPAPAQKHRHHRRQAF